MYKHPMAGDDYRQALEAAIAEYETLGARRREIDARLSQLAQTIGALNRLCGFAPTAPWGLTDACRLVLKNAAAPLTPTEVRDRLASIGFDLSRHSNPLASIHTVLKRLNRAGELRLLTRSPGRHAYVASPAAPMTTIVMTRAQLQAFLRGGDDVAGPK
jgi:hypothetical protein